MNDEFEHLVADAINDTNLNEFEGLYETETYGLTDDLDEWHWSRLEMNGFLGWWDAAKYIIHNFNVVKCQLTRLLLIRVRNFLQKVFD